MMCELSDISQQQKHNTIHFQNISNTIFNTIFANFTNFNQINIKTTNQQVSYAYPTSLFFF